MPESEKKQKPLKPAMPAFERITTPGRLDQGRDNTIPDFVLKMRKALELISVEVSILRCSKRVD
jgi:hypothetical protein